MDQYTQQYNSAYAKNLERYGLNSPASIGWGSSESQLLRFQVLSEIADLQDCSILDVGCGLGDLSHYLKRYDINYTGIDVSPELVNGSHQKYPGIHTFTGDFLNYDFNATFDYVFCSGAFHPKHPNGIEYRKTVVRKMFELANRGVSFDMPSSYYTQSDNLLPNPQAIDNIEIDYTDPAEMYRFCKTITPHVTLRDDYMPHDFTIYLYRDK